MTSPRVTKGIKSLHQMEYDEVSLVDVPANQYAAVMIAKRHTGDTMTAPAVDELYDLDGTQVFEDELETGDIVQDADGQQYEYTSPEDAAEAEYEDTEDTDETYVGKSAYSAADRAVFGAARGARKTRDAARGARSSARARFGSQRNAGAGRGTMNRSASTSAGGDLGSAGARGNAIEGPSAAWRAGRAVGRGARGARSFAGRSDVRLGAAGIAGGGVGAGGAAYADNRRHVGKSLGDSVREALSKAYSDADRDEVIAKALDQIDGMSDEMNVLAEIAKSERTLRLEGEYIEVSKGLGLPVDDNVFGPALMQIAERCDENVVQVIAKALEATSGVLYEERGYEGYGPQAGDPAMADAEAAAEARISKAGGEPVSKAAGIEAYYLENPPAYDEYMASRRG